MQFPFGGPRCHRSAYASLCLAFSMHSLPVVATVFVTGLFHDHECVEHGWAEGRGGIGLAGAYMHMRARGLEGGRAEDERRVHM